MKVITYNILSDKWCIYKPDDPSTHKLKNRYEFVLPELLLWENRLPKIINKINHNIICLQEVDLVYTSDIIKLLPDHNAYHHIINKTDKTLYKRANQIGNMTLWKKHIECTSQRCNSCALFTTFKMEKEFLLINLHLKGGRDFEAQRISQLKSCLKNISVMPVCICGDFNDEFKGELPKLLINFTFYPNVLTCDCYHNNQHHYHSFDHVVSKDLTIKQWCEEIEPIPNIDNPSDHLPLIFEIQF